MSNWTWKNKLTDDNIIQVKKLCDEWEKNKLRNPITKAKIMENKVTYNDIKKICESKKIKQYKSVVKSSSSKEKEEKQKKEKSYIEDIEDKEYFPKIEDKKFIEKLHNLQELSVHRTKELNEIRNLEDFENQVLKECPDKTFNKAYFQYFIQQYLSKRSLYKNILLFYSVGVGKSCSAVSIAEGFLENYSSYEEPLIWVILPKSLKTNFYNTIYDFSLYHQKQCTSDLYIKLAKIKKETPLKEAQTKILKIIKQRYLVLTYGEFEKHVSGGKKVENKILIVDEAHNLRNKTAEKEEDLDEDEKISVKTYNILKDVLENGENNRLILMSGTPMYNKPNEIIELLNLFLINDKKEPINKLTLFDKNGSLTDKFKDKLIELSSKYISYITNINPFSYSIRLSPKEAYKTIPSFIKNKKDYQWINHIKDGVILVKLGSKQEDYYKTHNMNMSHLSGFESMNIVYEDQIGKTGFNNIFEKTKNNSLSVKYRNEEILSEKLLPKYANKISILLNNIKKSNGIIIVYSRFLWAGIIPCAIALEHIGYSRYGVKNNILNNGKERDKKLNYAILTTPVDDLMGNESYSFDKLIQDINHNNNKNGENIKVVLITQKASEGISFFNVREIHILDPWYHVNRLEQIVGRGIRRCSHIRLPLENRNTMIYNYCGYIEDMVSKDVFTLKTAGEKVKNVNEITEVIRNNSIDCGIHKYINYYPKEIFKFNFIDIVNSRNEKIRFDIKDFNENTSCVMYKGNDMRGVREDNMKITENLINRIIDYILKNKKKWYSIDEIITNIKTYDGDDIYMYYSINKCLYPNEVIDNHYLYLHKDGIQLVQKQDDSIYSSILISDKKDKIIVQENTNYSKLLDNINLINDKFARLFKIYKTISSKNFKDIILTIIKNQKYGLLQDDLYNEGIILFENNSIIGYIDIFHKDQGYDLNGNDIPKDKMDKIIKKYEKVEINDKKIYGKLEITKKKEEIIINFKLYIDKKSNGANCYFKNKPELIKMFKDKNLILDETKSRDIICHEIALNLYNSNDLYFIPDLKPKKK